jgi:hypothetical protein
MKLTRRSEDSCCGTLHCNYMMTVNNNRYNLELRREAVGFRPIIERIRVSRQRYLSGWDLRSITRKRACEILEN